MYTPVYTLRCKLWVLGNDKTAPCKPSGHADGRRNMARYDIISNYSQTRTLRANTA